jgi:hypothetical protein
VFEIRAIRRKEILHGGVYGQIVNSLLLINFVVERDLKCRDFNTVVFLTVFLGIN